MKTVMIMGGSKGVGKEILKSCLNKGYNVSFCGRSSKEGEEIIRSTQAENQLYFHKLDLNSIDEIENFYNQTIKRFNKIDALILYAGITPVASIIDTTEDIYDSVFNINLKAPYFLLKHVLKGMVEQRSGSILFFGSAHMDYGQIDRAPYALTKSTLYTLSNHIAHHYAKYGVRSNYLVMGWTNTEGELELRTKEGVSEESLKEKASTIIPMGRMLNTKDPIPAVMYFISDDSAMTTGSLIRITGGEFI
ncbi:SDR family NAD(P)-dependent oxidoreductase [Flagellimonas zhangzhouensis]|uniref:NAD(P)-dependent dehydrogenase, short-chain alcohol dehydrogenase family n=1 Tax=Flagellimonas zhangzhouensis TaxID=1073328 RepID=A0A1H2YRY9_9FLAO|nr:SDR family oxidoreductase [Allomuricauda zhangzhouensis]SDR00418.1 2-deoxy-D-gluconate 3-dehydrogenase/dehydrogenase/reductase SDR family member 4 [Allomuricauda zhangzhouensis]SDX07404.1 NAD(P)-dependent dehydrogenase, short-chain alcohol dehydrogenase family [Allomuricauda zhangzhouensis]